MRSQLLNVQSWHNQPSLETEDEDTLPHSHHQNFVTPTEEQTDSGAVEEIQENPLLVASYERLAHNASNSTSNGHQEWAQDWLQLQQKWVEKIGEDDNYFDDHL